jgi:hypothetical protein
MSPQSDSPIEHGIGGSLNWLIGGAVGGIVGSLIFGGLLWVIDPNILIATVPAIYGLDPAATVGWGVHLLHGLVLGIVFGFLVTRDPILGTLTADVETGFIATVGPGLRFAVSGVVYGLAVWAVLPVIGLSLWISIGRVDNLEFPAATLESLIGHLLYGLLLGALFSVFVETVQEAEETEAPFEEASDSSQK